MTQAFNLSQFANKVNTSGQADLTTAVTGTLPVANGGTGVTSAGTNGNVLTSNGSAWVSQALPASGVSSINGQTGAVTTTNIDSIGSSGIYIYTAASTATLNTPVYVAANTTVAGSSLRYDICDGTSSQSNTIAIYANGPNNTTSYSGGGTALSGTWRVMARAQYSANANLGAPGYKCRWTGILVMRIS
jgi:hypothetical protein